MLSLSHLFHRVSYEVVSKSLSSVTCTIPNAYLWNHNGIQSQSSPLKIYQRKGMLASSEKQWFASCLFIAFGRRLLKDNKKIVTATCICIWFSCASMATSWGKYHKMLPKCQKRGRAHLVPYGRLCHNPFLGPLDSPAVALPLLAQLSPRVDDLLETEQEAAAREVENQRKPNDEHTLEHIYYRSSPLARR